MAPDGGKQKGKKKGNAQDDGNQAQGSGKASNNGNKGSSEKKQVMPRIVQHEAVHTLNYLFQSASYLAALATKSTAPSLAISRARQLIGLSKKATTRLDTSLKRSICRRCRAPLVLEGLTSCVRIRRSGPHGWVKVTKCLVCARKQVIPLGYGVEEERRRRKRKSLKRKQKRKEKIAAAREERVVNADATGQPKKEEGKDNDGSTTKRRPTSQRSRRRAAMETRRKLEAMQDAETGRDTVSKLTDDHPNRKPRRRRKKSEEDAVQPHKGHEMGVDAAASSLDDDTSMQDLETKREPAKRKRKRRKGTTSSNPLTTADSAPQKSLSSTLPRYTDRVQGDDDWDKAIESLHGAGQLQQEHIKALRSLRGDHMIAHGIGRGGLLGPS